MFPVKGAAAGEMEVKAKPHWHHLVYHLVPPHFACPPQVAPKEVEAPQGHFPVPPLKEESAMFPVKGAAAGEMETLRPRRKVKAKHPCGHNLVYSCSSLVPSRVS